MTATDHEFAWSEATTHIADDGGYQHDQRERHVEAKMATNEAAAMAHSQPFFRARELSGVQRVRRWP